MSHHIEKLSIENFKSCKELNINLTNFVPLVGYNNAGKSNILSAIEWLLKPKILSKSDFNNLEKPITVSGQITGITPELLETLEEGHRKAIAPFITDGNLTIKRNQPIDASKATDIELFVQHPSNGFKKNPTGISNAIKNLFPEPIRIAAMDNAADDSSKSKSTSTIGKLLAEFCNSVRDKNSARIDRHLNAISRRMSADGSNRLPELSEIDASINTKIDDLFPGLSLKLHFETPSFEDIFKAGTVRVYEESNIVSRDFSAYGHGAQRSIQMALIRHLAEIRKEAEKPTTTLLLIDEPELYLHPFAIEQVREALHTLSNHGYQVLFSTHSAQMITAERAQHTLLIRKTFETGTIARKRLKDAFEKVFPSSLSQAHHIFSLSQSTQVLFSNKVILTEGKTELRLLPFIFSKKFGKTLGQHQIALIETGSVDNIPKTLRVLKELDLPAVAIVDLDFAFRGAIKHGFIKENCSEIVELRKSLGQLEANGECKLNGGLPTGKNSPCTAAEAYEKLCADTSCKPHIQNLHNQLLENNIWLWYNGAIEAHLGTLSKSEEDWINFKTEIEEKGIDKTCKDPESINNIMEWIALSDVKISTTTEEPSAKLAAVVQTKD